MTTWAASTSTWDAAAQSWGAASAPSTSTRAIYDAMRAKLDGIGIPVGFGDMTGVLPPFISVWGSGRDKDTDEGLSRCAAFSLMAGITCTADTAAIAIDIFDAALDRLTPGLNPSRLDIPGRHTQITHFDSRDVQIDRTVTGTEPNTHAAFIVGLFRIHSQPKEA